jgi:hypothetical protein
VGLTCVANTKSHQVVGAGGESYELSDKRERLSEGGAHAEVQGLIAIEDHWAEQVAADVGLLHLVNRPSRQIWVTSGWAMIPRNAECRRKWRFRAPILQRFPKQYRMSALACYCHSRLAIWGGPCIRFFVRKQDVKASEIISCTLFELPLGSLRAADLSRFGVRYESENVSR